ncbi:MAG: HAD-IB family phosphatase [Anaerolineae bacterium]|jgi:phosphoserine phosphatase
MRHWRAYDLVFFDCDSTLTRIEGIDELARLKGLFPEVQRLTAAAMDGEVHLSSVYDRRLDLLRPTRADIRTIERLYRVSVVSDAHELTAALQFLGRQVFIVSGGLAPAVIPFGQSLGVPREHVHAVDVAFNRLAGRWWDYHLDREGFNPDEHYLDHENGPLTETHGKADIVHQLRRGRPGRALLVGDGISDLMARPALDLLVGFGGVVRRERVATEADVFIECDSLAPILPLSASPSDCQRCDRMGYGPLLRKGLHLIREGAVRFCDSDMHERILKAYEGVSPDAT